MLNGGLSHVRRVVVAVGLVAMAAFTLLPWVSLRLSLGTTAGSGFNQLPDIFTAGFPVHLWDLEGGWLLVPIAVVVACGIGFLRTMAGGAHRAPNNGAIAAAVVLLAEGVLYVRLWIGAAGSVSHSIPVLPGLDSSVSSKITPDVGAWLTLAVAIALLLFPLALAFVPKYRGRATSEASDAPVSPARRRGAFSSGVLPSAGLGAPTVAASAPAPVTAPSAAPAGWYQDPSDASLQRYFDGSAWTQFTAPR